MCPRAGAGQPGFAQQVALLVGSRLAEKFHRVTPLDEGEACADRPFQLDRADFAAIRCALQSALQLLIVIELPVGMAASAMKNSDESPEEVVEIGLDAGILQASGKRIEHVSDRTGGKSRIGQWARIGLVVERTISKELHLLKKQMGRPRLEGAFIKAVVRIGHLRSPRCAALSRPSRRPSGRRAGPAPRT